MNLIYDSGRVPLVLRLAACVAAVVHLVLAILMLIAIPFPALVGQRNGSIGAMIFGACFALFMAIIIGSAWRTAIRIEDDDRIIRVSRDWLFGTFCDEYEKSQIDCFEIKPARNYYRIWLVKRLCEDERRQPSIGFLYDVGAKLRRLGQLAERNVQMIQTRNLKLATDVNAALNRCLSTHRVAD